MGRINKTKRKLKLGYSKLIECVLVGLTFIFKPILNFLSPYINPIARKIYHQLSKSINYLVRYLNRYLISPIKAKLVKPIANKLGRRWTRRIKYTLKYGLSSVALIAIVAFAAHTVINNLITDSYHLPISVQAMIGSPDTSLMKSQLSYSSKTKTYYLDKSGIGAKSSSSPGVPSGANSITIGSHSNSAFSLVIPTNIHQGFTTYDNTSGLSFTLTPEFDAMNGKIVDGRLVYPMGLSSTKDVYTVKANGLQENIVYNSAPKGTVKLSYKLSLPNTLQARMMPNGDIGIYSAGSYLFGNISYGSSKDQALVAKARLNAAKTTLVFVLPAPQVTDNDGNAPIKVQQRTKFSLKGDILTLTATDLGGIHGPLSIDPSVIDASASAFQTGNNESDISFSGSDVSEAGLSGGVLSANTNSCGTSWCASSTTANTGFSLPTSTADGSTIVYDGYIYFMGGNTGSVVPTVDYAVLNTNGSLGAPPTCTGTGSVQNTDWCESSTFANTGFSLPTATDQASAAVYNGYIYFMGGANSSGTILPTVDYAVLNANGSLGAPSTCTGTGSVQNTDWCESSTIANTGFSLPVVTDWLSAAVYNGYIYFMGGYNGGSTPIPTVGYAALNANGSLGAPSTCTGTGSVQNTDWCASSTTANTGFSLPVGTDAASAVVYNGYIYFMGGYNSAWALVPTVDYAVLNANGSLGAPSTCTSTGSVQNTDWCESSTSANTGFSLPAATSFASIVVCAGYIYFMGGYTGSPLSTVDYAPIYNGGGIGPWASTASLPTATTYASAVAYNGFIYFMGGANSSVDVPTVDYAQITSAGAVANWSYSTSTSNGSLPNAIDASASAVYNGYIYEIGGCEPSCNPIATVDYIAINSNGTLGTWNSTSTLPSTSSNSTAVAYGGYLYNIGGCAASCPSTVVDYALINSNGSLGSWASTASLPTGDYAATAAVYNGYIYEIGGCASSCPSTVVDYASINSNGTLGTWTATTALLAANQAAASVVYNGYIYEMGGYTVSGSTAAVDYAPINANGTIGSWVATASLVAATYSANAVVYNGYIYEIAGFTSGYNAATQWAQINNGGPGTLPSWSSASVSGYNSNALYGSTSVAYNGHIYVIGGCAAECSVFNGAPSRQVYYSAISSGGTLGSWSTTTALSTTTGQGFASSAVYNGYIYVLGGCYSTSGDDCASKTSTVYYASIGSTGALGAWTSTTGLPQSLEEASAVAYNGYIYEIGGYNTTNGLSLNVYYTSISSTGALGLTWSNATNLPNAMGLTAAIVYDGYMYVMGGCTHSAAGDSNMTCANRLSAVDYASIGSTGALGSWTATTALPQAVSAATAVAYDGYVYFIGGYSGSNSSTVYYAPINNGGTLGSWSTTTSLTATASMAASVAYNGYIYEVWSRPPTSSPAIYYASLNSIPRIGFYSELIDMSGSSTEDPSADALLVNGTQTGNPGIGSLGGPGTGGITINYQFGSNACPTLNSLSVLTTSPVLVGKPYYMTSSSNGCSSSSDTNFGRWVWVTVKLDDSQTAAFPDSSGNHATITGLSLYYHPASNGRLRGGATFNSGSAQALDTPP